MAKKSPNPTDVYAGKRLRMRRMMLGMSQEQLGDCAGITFQQVQKYEKGTNRLSASRIQQFAVFLQVQPSFFFEGAPNSNGASARGAADVGVAVINDFLSASGGIEMAKGFLALDRETRHAFVNLIGATAAMKAKKKAA